MDLHALVRSVIPLVNTDQEAVILRSAGYAVDIILLIIRAKTSYGKICASRRCLNGYRIAYLHIQGKFCI